MIAHLALYLFSALWVSAVAYVAYSARNSSVFKDTSSILPAGDAAEVAYYADSDTTPKDDQLLTWLSAAGAGGILLIFGLKRAFSGKNPLDQTNKKIGESIKIQKEAAEKAGKQIEDTVRLVLDSVRAEVAVEKSSVSVLLKQILDERNALDREFVEKGFNNMSPDDPRARDWYERDRENLEKMAQHEADFNAAFNEGIH